MEMEQLLYGTGVLKYNVLSLSQNSCYVILMKSIWKWHNYYGKYVVQYNVLPVSQNSCHIMCVKFLWKWDNYYGTDVVYIYNVLLLSQNNCYILCTKMHMQMYQLLWFIGTMNSKVGCKLQNVAKEMQERKMLRIFVYILSVISLILL